MELKEKEMMKGCLADGKEHVNIGRRSGGRQKEGMMYRMEVDRSSWTDGST